MIMSFSVFDNSVAFGFRLDVAETLLSHPKPQTAIPMNWKVKCPTRLHFILPVVQG